MAGPRDALGDGSGALCPACVTWFREVDEEWRAHVAGEHPRTWERLRTAVASRTHRAKVRRDVQAEATALAEQIREHRRHAA